MRGTRSTRAMRLPLLALVAGALACATQLRPAPGVQTAAGPGLGAIDREAGVEVEARVQAWRWTPERLETELTPVQVQIDNESEHPLRIRFEDFAPVDAAGRRHAALPPFDMEAKVAVRVNNAYGLRRFHVAPHLRPYYPHAPFFHTGFAGYHSYYDSYYTTLRQIELPTSDMLERALPEGVADPGGGAAGFLYFERVRDPAEGRVDLRFALVDAETEERFGTIEIPFREESGLLGGGDDGGY